ncbi:hypothetical protein [Actinobaculum suis]|uniref:Uncharacterized protein n=1 Tax=Actinobaculum suis TaxID=1657 RepID=A0AAW9HSF0_9ACTO|nr:hypothetical protein [Actinobaculum suis]MDY5153295.1 hypothetical protein [Actinobaculum suis]
MAVVDDDFVVDVHHDPMAGRGGLEHGTDQEAAGWELRNSSEVTWRLPLPTAESRAAAALATTPFYVTAPATETERTSAPDSSFRARKETFWKRILRSRPL